VHRKQEIPEDEAVGSWYDRVYLPLVRVTRERDLLREFPGWSEADLYLELSEHWSTLEEAVGQEVELELAAEDLMRQVHTKATGFWAQARRRFRTAVRGRWAVSGKLPWSSLSRQQDGGGAVR
jgi:hypothetical protein